MDYVECYSNLPFAKVAKLVGRKLEPEHEYPSARIYRVGGYEVQVYDSGERVDLRIKLPQRKHKKTLSRFEKKRELESRDLEQLGLILELRVLDKEINILQEIQRQYPQIGTNC